MLLGNFFKVSGLCGTYTVGSRLQSCVKEIRQIVGNDNILVSMDTMYCTVLYCTIVGNDNILVSMDTIDTQLYCTI